MEDAMTVAEDGTEREWTARFLKVHWASSRIYGGAAILVTTIPAYIGG